MVGVEALSGAETACSRTAPPTWLETSRKAGKQILQNRYGEPVDRVDVLTGTIRVLVHVPGLIVAVIAHDKAQHPGGVCSREPVRAEARRDVLCEPRNELLVGKDAEESEREPQILGRAALQSKQANEQQQQRNDILRAHSCNDAVAKFQAKGFLQRRTRPAAWRSRRLGLPILGQVRVFSEGDSLHLYLQIGAVLAHGVTQLVSVDRAVCNREWQQVAKRVLVLHGELNHGLAHGCRGVRIVWILVVVHEIGYIDAERFE